MATDDELITLPTRALVHRLARDLAERDHLLTLLTQVADGHHLTNRLNEATLIVPEQVLTDIRQAIGAAVSPEGTTSPTQETP